MKQILIVTEPEDIHALAIAWHIENQGHQIFLWHTTDFPSLQSISISDLDTKPLIKINGLDISFNSNMIDAVWMRRLSQPVIPNYITKPDREFAKRECIYTLRSVWTLLSKLCQNWVNPLSSDWINDKSVQLNIANKLGFQTPKTIVTNDPKAIREFYKYNKGNVIYKSFAPMSWKSTTSIHRSETVKISREALFDNRMLSASPGIFQVYVQKSYEVRVTVIGNQCFAVKLDSQANHETIDWRLQLEVNPFPTIVIKLPEKLEEQIRNFMHEVNLIFGCFDFIVNMENEWVFIEVNPMGQFLWLEELCPELSLLETFSNLLIYGVDGTKIRAKNASSGYLDFLKYSDKNNKKSRHVPAKNAFMSFEK